MSKLINIIFLDIDGVLCNPRSCLAVGNSDRGYTYLDPIACLLIKKLCDECNARLVISSSWRMWFDKSAMAAILNANCLNLGDMILDDHKFWRTKNLNAFKGKEIEDWIKNSALNYINFVIIDNNNDIGNLSWAHVKTNAYDGIGYMNYLNAKKILNGKWDE